MPSRSQLYRSKFTLQMKIDYRNAKKSDIEYVSELCSNVFDGPFEWHQQLQKMKSITNYKTQLMDRYVKLVDNGVCHSMIVAVDSGDNSIVGFSEIGMLPYPLKVEDVLQNQPSVSENETEQSAEQSTEGESIWALDTSETKRGDVPYLGNVAVAGSARRQGVGTKLIRIGQKVAQKWGYDQLWVAVDSTNTPAVSMYKKLNFVVEREDGKEEEGSIYQSSRNVKIPRVFMRLMIKASEGVQNS